jgi:hypothetical protein
MEEGDIQYAYCEMMKAAQSGELVFDVVVYDNVSKVDFLEFALSNPFPLRFSGRQSPGDDPDHTVTISKVMADVHCRTIDALTMSIKIGAMKLAGLKVLMQLEATPALTCRPFICRNLDTGVVPAGLKVGLAYLRLLADFVEIGILKLSKEWTLEPMLSFQLRD